MKAVVVLIFVSGHAAVSSAQPVRPEVLFVAEVSGAGSPAARSQLSKLANSAISAR